ncbi:MAG: SPOR domain-containing protein [Microcoleus sp. CSU_2_2]|nr:SPOR domain-containing protein [Microcoleus sp. SU_5_3]NJS11467.1 SPOR domain-containing protein [Microcoleus sp. CSU_2_2]
MSKRSSVESPNQLSSTPIKPVLQAALGCLDVNLEAELTQYRRHRRRAEQWVSPSVRPGKQTGTTDQQLGKNPPATAEETQQLLSMPLSLAGVPGDAPIVTARNSTPTKLSGTTSAPDNYLESSEKLIESLDEPRGESIEERSLAASLFTPLGLSSMLLFLLSCTALGYAVMHPSSVVKMAGLNRWFDRNTPSTEERPASTTVADTSNKELPKAPNLASKESAFVELDLSTLSNVKPTVSPIASPSPKASIPPTPVAIPIQTRAVPIPTEDGNSPRGNQPGLNNLSTALLPSPNPSLAQPVPTLPTLPPTSSPTITTVSPTPASAAAASAAPASPAPVATLGTPTRAADGFYYVVTDYTDEKSLQQARTAVPDAYVRNFSKGVKIQMGALNDAASAERLAKELQAKGVRPQYYQP